MKLYLYDEKHEQIIAEKDIGDVSDSEKGLLQNVATFLEDNHVTTRYKRLVVADGYRINHDEDYETRVVEFT